MGALALNCGHTIRPTSPHGEWPISTAGGRRVRVPLDSTCPCSLVTPSTSQPMMEPPAKNCGLTTHPIIPHGKRLTSTAVQSKLGPAKACSSSSAIRSISTPAPQPRAMNYGRTTPPTIPHGKWLTSEAVQVVVPLECTSASSSVIRSISMRMTEAQALNFGRTTRPIVPHGE